MSFFEWVGLMAIAVVLAGGLECVGDGIRDFGRQIRLAAREAREDWDD